MGGGRPQAARDRRARGLRPRAEDRRLRHQPRVRERDLRARRHARRRRAGRGRHAQPAHDRRHPAADAGRRTAARRGARRGVHAALRLPRVQRAAHRRGEADRAEPAQRLGGIAPAEGLLHHRATAALDLGVRDRAARGPRRADDALGDAAVAARARVPHESARGARGVDRGDRRARARLGAATGGARLRDRRHRDQGRLVRPAGAPRLAARTAALGARVQVGADDRRHAAGQDPHPRRTHGRAQPVGRARAGRGGRRHHLARDAAQRGGHQPQGDPRGRRRHRPACGRRDSADRRSGRRAPEGNEAFPHADALPAVRHRGGEARRRGDAPLPEPGLPVARARGADQLGDGGGRHRRRRRAVGAPAAGISASCAPSRSCTG